LRRIPLLKEHALESFFESAEDCQRVVDGFLRGDSFLICGSTGSGKSTFLAALLQRLSVQTRILVLEDSPELPVPNPLSSKLLARPNRFGFREGVEWGLSELVFESLRMRPDRLILGECRGSEARAIYQALGTGHKGFATTIHAGSAEEGLRRFFELALCPTNAELRKLWKWVLTLSLSPQGPRRVTEILRAEP
jgi:Flp pilus assembly CpaF family ATPase